METGGFTVHLQVDRLGRLDTNDEFVASDILEDALCNILELNPDFHFGFIEGYLWLGQETSMTSTKGGRNLSQL